MAVSSHQFLVCTICHHRVYRHHPSDVRTPGDGQCPQCGANMIPYSIHQNQSLDDLGN